MIIEAKDFLFPKFREQEYGSLAMPADALEPEEVAAVMTVTAARGIRPALEEDEEIDVVVDDHVADEASGDDD